MSRVLPSKPSVEFLKKEAKDLHAAHQARDPKCLPTLRMLRQFADAVDEDIFTSPLPLTEVQFALARDYGFAGWNQLIAGVEAGTAHGPSDAPPIPASDEVVAACDAELARKPVSQRTAEELIPFLVELSRVARRHGLLGLDKYPERLDDEFLAMGLRHAADGTDRGYVHDILTVRKKALMAVYERRLDMMIAGCDAVLEGMNPRLVESKCRAML